MAFARAIARRAQVNSVAKIASPIGITIKAGPGRTISAMPINKTVPPITPTISFRRGAAITFRLPTQPRSRANKFFTAKKLILDRERRQPLLKLRRRVRHDLRAFALVAQLQHVADPMNLGDQS